MTRKKPPTRALQVIVPKQLYRDLELVAIFHGESMSSIVRAWLKEKIEMHKAEAVK